MWMTAIILQPCYSLLCPSPPWTLHVRAFIQQFEEMQVPNMGPQQSEDEELNNSPKEEK